MVPPVSWRLFLDEVKTYLVDDLGMADDSALATALDVQRAILPARERSFPLELELDHDFAAWHRAALDARGADHRHDWTSVVPRLGSYGPATLPVDDPHGVCSGAMSEVLASLNLQGGFWEFSCDGELFLVSGIRQAERSFPKVRRRQWQEDDGGKSPAAERKLISF